MYEEGLNGFEDLILHAQNIHQGFWWGKVRKAMKFKKNKKQNNRGFRGPGTNLDNKREGGREISCCNCIVSGLVQRGALADWKEAEEGKLPYQKRK